MIPIAREAVVPLFGLLVIAGGWGLALYTRAVSRRPLDKNGR